VTTKDSTHTRTHASSVASHSGASRRPFGTSGHIALTSAERSPGLQTKKPVSAMRVGLYLLLGEREQGEETKISFALVSATKTQEARVTGKVPFAPSLASLGGSSGAICVARSNPRRTQSQI
jgi:hypothetical protein